MDQRLILPIVAVISGLFLLYLSQSNLLSKQMDNVKISLPPGKFLNTYFPLYVAQQRNFFSEQGLNVTLFLTDSGDSIYEMLSGNVQFATLIPSSMTYMISGSDIKLVMVFSKDDSFLYSNFSSVSDLKDKRIAIPSTGTISYSNLLSALKNANVSAKDVQFYTIANIDERVDAFKSGKVDALTATNIAFKPGETMMAVYLAQNYTWNRVGGVIATSNYIKENPQIVTRLVTATAQAVNYIYDNPEDSVKLIESAFDVDEQQANDIYKFILTNHYYIVDMNLQDLQLEMNGLATAQGRKPVNIENFTDASFINNLPENLIR